MIPQLGDTIINENPLSTTPPPFKSSALPSIPESQNHLSTIQDRKKSPASSLASDGESTILSSVSSMPPTGPRSVVTLAPIAQFKQQNKKTPVYSGLQMDDLEKQFLPYIYDVDYYDMMSTSYAKDRVKYLQNGARRNNCSTLKSGLRRKSNSSMVAAEM
uniref:Uncharacterized protein n=1 Tax=Romanomermis culicivorax TaxID=13658 RepID=A0A915KM64_ROMCU